ncbi:unnamed protein product [Heligmosomoides polygyrus]|uniref:3'-5' exonuclease domain-containing protein n=1 Tax=Heligmosomoides polygyrus TaxID=6339 RepID=A0A183GS26_HELPZ|nr:unnamed protein product [Heligmosomoides polygyrus]
MISCFEEPRRWTLGPLVLIQNALRVFYVEMSNGSFFADLILFRFAGLTRSTADGEEEDSEHSPIVHFKLSDLSERLLGVKLDKSEQCSNWAIRPLRTSQKVYAAMDAYIVVELFSKLKTTAEQEKKLRGLTDPTFPISDNLPVRYGRQPARSCIICTDRTGVLYSTNYRVRDPCRDRSHCHSVLKIFTNRTRNNQYR